MSSASLGSVFESIKISPRAKTNKYAADCMIPMGITSENVAEKYGITRE